MIAMTLAEVARACGGRLIDADPSLVVTAVVNDSRAVIDGALFVALPGDRTDGHRFVGAAIDAGAAAALIAEAQEGSSSGPRIAVADPLEALLDVASAARARLDATTIAITGSSGKTGTKDLTAAAAGVERAVVSSQASFNNELGVPLTILAAEEGTEVLVVEVGSRGVGHIAALAPAIAPDIAIVTNVGPAHIGMFGSLEATAKAKGELVEALRPQGVAVLNADDPAVRAMADRTAARVVFVGSHDDATVRADDVRLDADARASFTLIVDDRRAPVSLRLVGEHMVANALCAAGAAAAAGCSIEAIADGLSSCEGAAWRMEVRDHGSMRVLNDAYNANPDSMAAALKALMTMGRSRPTWAVLGEMAELGETALEAHDRIGRLAVRLGVHHLVTVGENARAIHEAARMEGMFGGEATFVADADEAIGLLAQAEPDAVILIKGSRAAGLERVAEALTGGAR